MTVEKVRGEKRVIRNAGPIVNVRVNGAGNEGAVLQQEEQTIGCSNRTRILDRVQDGETNRVVLMLDTIGCEQREIRLTAKRRWCVVDCHNQIPAVS